MSLTQAIKEQAYSLGFSLVGVTSGDPLPHADVFLGWLEQGRHGGMAYLDTPRSRDCRAHPANILAECRSVLVLGTRYAAPQPMPIVQQDEPVCGGIAAYAWGEDYHLLLPERLDRLVSFIEGQAGHRVASRVYTDTGPLLERELAQRAGLGWIGRNTCLIHPRRGSYFLLAEILLGIQLEPDPPFTADRCGTCRRCMEACPTGCILPDRTLDAKRCISYLTIELKSSIPPDLRPQMDGWVFGCDVCQQVCPWNRFAEPGADPAFAQRLADPHPDLAAEMALQPAEFKLKYRNSPLLRAKRGGYLRNLAVALGNTHNPRVIPALEKALTSDPQPLVRAHVAWALGQIESSSARKVLAEAAGRETDGEVKNEIELALGED